MGRVQEKDLELEELVIHASSTVSYNPLTPVSRWQPLPASACENASAAWPYHLLSVVTSYHQLLSVKHLPERASAGGLLELLPALLTLMIGN